MLAEGVDFRKMLTQSVGMCIHHHVLCLSNNVPNLDILVIPLYPVTAICSQCLSVHCFLPLHCGIEDQIAAEYITFFHQHIVKFIDNYSI